MFYGYCVTGDVVKHLPGRNFFEEDVLGRVVVTVSDVEGYIELVASEIDALLTRLDFTLPVTEANSPSGYNILRHINALGAAALAEEAWSTAMGEVSERAKLLKARYENWLTRISDHTINLIDISGGPAMPSDLADSGCLDTDEAGAEREIFFEREMEW